MRDLGKIPQGAEIDCFARTIERLETDLPSMRRRANLWSLGDVDGLRKFAQPDDEGACLNAFLAVPQFHEQFERASSQLEDLWMTTVESAIQKNSSTFAVLSLTKLLKHDGVLDRLKARGYDVREPQ